MLTVLFLPLIGLCVWFGYMQVKDNRGKSWCNKSEAKGIISIVFGVAAGIVFVTIICLFSTVSTVNVKQQKIDMYKSENAKIEKQVQQVVSQYQSYEQGTFKDLHDPSLLVSLYPELKSDTLVTQQIQVYVKNNDKIKSLNEEIISVNVDRWLLYFGGTK